MTLPNNRIRNGFLDDRFNAQKFYDEKLIRAKDLIYQILGVTTGYDHVTKMGSEWGHANFMELLEMFQIRHKNFSRSDLAEHLQDALFQYTKSCDESQRKWRDKIFTDRGLDDDGEPLETKEETDKETVLDLSEHTTKEDECIDLAKQLSSIIHNKNTPETVRNAIVDSLGTMPQPLEVVDSPEYIAKVLCDNLEVESE